jgi:hypothetical protein
MKCVNKDCQRHEDCSILDIIKVARENCSYFKAYNAKVKSIEITEEQRKAAKKQAKKDWKKK